jgi:hypothetical protein
MPGDSCEQRKRADNPQTMKQDSELTRGQMRALQVIGESNGGRLPGIHWVTLRGLRHLGLCVLGPGRAATLTVKGQVRMQAKHSDRSNHGGES